MSNSRRGAMSQYKLQKETDIRINTINTYYANIHFIYIYKTKHQQQQNKQTNQPHVLCIHTLLLFLNKNF